MVVFRFDYCLSGKALHRDGGPAWTKAGCLPENEWGKDWDWWYGICYSNGGNPRVMYLAP